MKKPMDQNTDAYGQEIMAFLNGTKAYELVEREDGFIDLSGGPAPYFAEYEAWPEHQKRAIQLARGKVLDVGTGAGRVALYLQSHEHAVTAIDNSPLAIEVCKRRGVKDARVLPIEDIDEFGPHAFDTIVMFGNNFGLMSNSQKAKVLLSKMHAVTSSKARIIAESRDPYTTSDPAHLSYQEWNRKQGKMAGQLKIRVRFRQYTGDWFEYLLVSKQEMEDILSGTGWKVSEYIDGDLGMYIAVLGKE